MNSGLFIQWSVDYPNVAQPNDRLSEGVEEWMDIDDEDPGYQIMQDNEILDLIRLTPHQLQVQIMKMKT